MQDRVQRRDSLEWRPTRQRFIKDRPQRVGVRRRPDGPAGAAGLLGSHVAGRADDGAFLRFGTAAVGLLGQTEINDLGCAVRREEHVGRLQVAVDDAAVVGRVDGGRQSFHNPSRLGRGQRRPLEFVGQAAALDEFQRKIRLALTLADLIDLHDVGVLQAGHRFGFAAETLDLTGARIVRSHDHLDATNRFKSRWRAL